MFLCHFDVVNCALWTQQLNRGHGLEISNKLYVQRISFMLRTGNMLNVIVLFKYIYFN